MVENGSPSPDDQSSDGRIREETLAQARQGLEAAAEEPRAIEADRIRQAELDRAHQALEAAASRPKVSTTPVEDASSLTPDQQAKVAQNVGGLRDLVMAPPAESEVVEESDEGRPDLTAHEKVIGRIPMTDEYRQMQIAAQGREFEVLKQNTTPLSADRDPDVPRAS